MAKLTRDEVIRRLGESSGIPEEHVESLLSSIAQVAQEQISDGFLLPGFGEFVIAPGPGREARNPATGTLMMMRGEPTVSFIPDAAANEALLDHRRARRSFSKDTRRVLPQVRLRAEVTDLRAADLPDNQGDGVLHKLGGEPDWIQSPETPLCCAHEMTFYGQLDSAIGGDFNLGDSGKVYVFVCDDCSRSRSIVQCY